MEFNFKRSLVLMRTFDTYDQRLRQEFLAQQEFIASQFGECEKRMDGRFEEMEKRMDGRFGKMEKKMDGWFQKVDRCFDELDSEIRDVKVHLENAAAITRNGRLRRMHQPINLIKVLKPGGDPNNFVWASHPQVPKHMKNTYTLGQQAKGIFEPSWDVKPSEESMCFFIYIQSISLRST